MLVPTNTDSIALSSLIGTPYNYWGDDDGDGQGIDGITATGSLNLSIVNRWNQPVSRNEVLTSCNSPYKLTLSNSDGILKTRYGVPNESRFNAGNVTYYIKPKPSPVLCFVRVASINEVVGLSDAVWISGKGYLPQSFTPSSYGLNFPTTGANNLYFSLHIYDYNYNQPLSWAPVSHGGITATITGTENAIIKVTLTGPVVTDSNQWKSTSPDRIDKPSLPQTFELVGRDSSGNAVVKYGFVLKQWFVNRGDYRSTYSSTESWCNKIGGYRVPRVRDLTNATCQGYRSDGEYECQGVVGATPSSPDNRVSRHIGAGFFTEWADMGDYRHASGDNRGRSNFVHGNYWTQDRVGSRFFHVNAYAGTTSRDYNRADRLGLCVYP
ncbi:hypothetical protein A9G15_10440 [Gilliamella apis]|uniref:hypothetical protein n=1 Tax=Gilliamella apis TaxID=1970738 RepID=UPI00080DFC00|nr:hypothetical protein [Gilliamella apis]OCG06404.1 hypothetical protein A9G15_10440 [Gilliamella apis]